MHATIWVIWLLAPHADDNTHMELPDVEPSLFDSVSNLANWSVNMQGTNLTYKLHVDDSRRLMHALWRAQFVHHDNQAPQVSGLQGRHRPTSSLIK